MGRVKTLSSWCHLLQRKQGSKNLFRFELCTTSSLTRSEMKVEKSQPLVAPLNIPMSANHSWLKWDQLNSLKTTLINSLFLEFMTNPTLSTFSHQSSELRLFGLSNMQRRGRELKVREIPSSLTSCKRTGSLRWRWLLRKWEGRHSARQHYTWRLSFEIRLRRSTKWLKRWEEAQKIPVFKRTESSNVNFSVKIVRY